MLFVKPEEKYPSASVLKKKVVSFDDNLLHELNLRKNINYKFGMGLNIFSLKKSDAKKPNKIFSA